MAQEYKGKSVYKGIVLGPIAVFKKNDVQVKREKITDTESEIARMQEAVSASQEQLQKLCDKAVKEVGEASAAIFGSTQRCWRMKIIRMRSAICPQ